LPTTKTSSYGVSNCARSGSPDENKRPVPAFVARGLAGSKLGGASTSCGIRRCSPLGGHRLSRNVATSSPLIFISFFLNNFPIEASSVLQLDTELRLKLVQKFQQKRPPLPL
jgi:hypothetical protein